MDNTELIEKLAAMAHDCWANWMRWEELVDSGMRRERWNRQMKTKYADLSEKEKQSDRDVVLKYQGPALEEIARLKADAEEAAVILGAVTGTHPEYCEIISQAQVVKQCLEISDERRLDIQGKLKSANEDFDEACLEASVAIKKNVTQAAALKLAREAMEAVEWSFVSVLSTGPLAGEEAAEWCPWCVVHEGTGHSDDCLVSQALAAIKAVS